MKIPNGWKKVYLGDVFSQRQENGIAGLPIFSVTINNGLVDRSTLERKMESNLICENHLLIRKGDLAYNMMRMWQGAVGVAEKDGLVSPAYVVLKPASSIDSEFAYRWFKSSRMLYLLGAYSHGITKDRLRLYYNDFSKIHVAMPPLHEQRAIAEILETWDTAIETTERLIEAKEKRFGALLSELIVEPKQLTKEGNEWKRDRLGDVCIVRKGQQLNVAHMKDCGAYYALNGGVTPSGRTDDWNTEAGTITISEGGNSCGYVNFNNERFWAGGHCYVIDNLSDVLTIKFLFYSLKSSELDIMRLRVGSGLPNIQKKDLDKFDIHFPHLNEQIEIAEVLNDAQQEIHLLEELATKYKDQKRGLMQKLLTGEWREKRVMGDVL